MQNLLKLNERLSREVTGTKLAGVDAVVVGERKHGIHVFTGQRWIRLGQRNLNPPIDCYEQLYIVWYIYRKYGDVSPKWLVAHAER